MGRIRSKRQPLYFGPGFLELTLEFPSKESATSFYESAEYAPFLNQRKAGADSNLILIAGEDIAAQ